jgi:hypothetical protein
MFAEREIIAAHADFDRVAQRGKADQFDLRAYQKPHFHKARTAFRREFYFNNGSGCAQRDRSQR